MKMITPILLILFVVLLANFAYAQHTFLNKREFPDGVQTSAIDPIVFSYNQSGNATLIVLSIHSTTITARTQTPPTYNGTSMTIAVPYLGDTAGEGTAEIWYLVNPPNGNGINYTVSVPSSTTNAKVIISSYKAQAGYTSALDSWNSSSSGGVNPSLRVATTVAGDVVVDALFGGLTSAPTANNGILLYKADTGAENLAAQYNLSNSIGVTNLSYTAASQSKQYYIASFKEVLLANLAPTWSNNQSNTTTPANNEWVTMNVTWTDSTPAQAWFGNNFTGIWKNDTPRTFTSGVMVGNITKVTAGENKIVCWQAWANDTSGQKNNTLLSCMTTRLIAPTYSGNGTNATTPANNEWVKIYVNWLDETMLNYTWISNNFTGAWRNETIVDRAGLTTINHTNITKITAGEGKNICWIGYANDTYGNGNKNLTTTNCLNTLNIAPTYTGNMTNATLIKINDLVQLIVNWSDETSLNYTWLGNNFTGTWRNETPVNRSGATFASHINITQVTVGVGNTICWQGYANDTSNNKNSTGVMCSIVSDSTPPFYSSNSTNSTVNGTDILHSLFWQDDIGLFGYIFSFNNGTSIWKNDSFVSMAGTGNWSNVTKTINATVGVAYSWCVYANDTSGNMNGSGCITPFTYVSTAPQAPPAGCSCNAPNDYALAWVINMSCYCNTTTVSWAKNITFTGNYGVWVINASVNYTSYRAPPPFNTTIRRGNNARLRRILAI